MNADIKIREICTTCKQSYDLEERKPCCYMPCGHTLKCSDCLTQCVDQKCTVCKEIVHQAIPDYMIIDSIKKSIHPELQVEYESKAKIEKKQNVIEKLTTNPADKKLIMTKNIKGKMLAFMKSDQS